VHANAEKKAASAMAEHKANFERTQAKVEDGQSSQKKFDKRREVLDEANKSLAKVLKCDIYRSS